MFSRMTLEQRLIVVNVALFLVAGAVALLLMTEEPTLPAKPDIEEIAGVLEHEENQDEGPDTEQAKNYEMFGEKDLFAMLVPFPTPSPTPPPTPPPDPKLAEAIKDWKLSGFGPNIVFMRDLKQNEDIIIDFDDPASKKQLVRFQNQDMEVVLESIDNINMTATFTYTGKQGKQSVTKNFFDD